MEETKMRNINLSRPTFGLVLGGGGARGLAHIGVLKVFEREGIPIDYLVGTSMGGLIAALYASGISPEDLEVEALKRGTTRELVRLVDRTPSRKGLLKGMRIYNQLADALGLDLTFADLKIPVAMNAVDLVSGREVVLSEGNVIDAVRATISLPGMFVPVEKEPFKLVDGGMLNNLPVSIARDLGAQIVIAVDVLPCFRPNQPGSPPEVENLELRRLPQAAKNIFDILLIMVSELTSLQMSHMPPDLLIRPDLPKDLDILLSFDRPTLAIDAGEKAAQLALPDIKLLASVQPEIAL